MSSPLFGKSIVVFVALCVVCMLRSEVVAADQVGKCEFVSIDSAGKYPIKQSRIKALAQSHLPNNLVDYVLLNISDTSSIQTASSIIQISLQADVNVKSAKSVCRMLLDVEGKKSASCTQSVPSTSLLLLVRFGGVELNAYQLDMDKIMMDVVDNVLCH